MHFSKFKVSKEELEELYWHKGLLLKDIAEKYGINPDTVTKALRRFGIPQRNKSQIGVIWWSRRNSTWNLAKEQVGDLYSRQRLSLDKIAKMFKIDRRTITRFLKESGIKIRPRYKGGCYTNCHGYTFVRLTKDSPYYVMANPKGYVSEHRLVMARHLGRPLLRTEVVHHRPDVAKDDNRIEVLYLMPNPSGHGKLMPCSNCELKREIRLLRWQIKEQGEQIRNLTRALSGLDR